MRIPARLARWGLPAVFVLVLACAVGCLGGAPRAPFSEESAALVAYYEPRRAADAAHVAALDAARAGDFAALARWREGLERALPSVEAFNQAHASRVTLSERGPWAVYAPSGKARATLLYLHGGGWCVGPARMNEAFCAALAEQAGVAVWSFAYPLAPERPFPAAPRAVAQALRDLRAKFPDRPLFVGGDSAGGGLAVGAALAAPGLADGLILYYPALAHDASDTPEWEAYKDVILLTADLMAAFSRAYVDETAARTDPQASPILADDAALRALPPVLTVAAECDLLAGLSRRFHGRLAALGREGDARVVVPGSLHGFLSFPQLPDAQSQALAATRAWLEARLR